MQLAKERIYDLLEDVPDSQLQEIADFIMFVKVREEKSLFKNLERLSASSTDFWDNEIDDEVWNDA